jgi:FkbM family methyltransferase
MFAGAPKVGGKATYQYEVLQSGLAYCRKFDAAVDVGAHVGLWSRVLCEHFAGVVAFEPVFGDCFRRNLEGKAHVTLHCVALSDQPGSAHMRIAQGNSGMTHIARAPAENAVTVPLRTLDSFRLTAVDLLKVDVEGWEYRVLRGAVQTLQRFRPVVICEHKGHDQAYEQAPGAVEYLQALGAEVLQSTKKDVIMGWR